jgi:hypothetical protein
MEVEAQFMTLQERQMDLIEVLGFLFMLSTMELGRVCSLSLINVHCS